MKNITTKNHSQNLNFPKEDIDFIKNQMFPLGASVKDIDFCLKVAQELGLNSITKEIFFLERKSQVNGNPTKFWADKPDTMIKKVAEAQALRKAFNINGIWSIDEVDGIITPQSQNNNDESLEVSAEVVDIN